MENLFNEEIENRYAIEVDVGYRRSLGQFFTPFKIARFMADWLLESPKKSLKILDPAAGFGIFERALKSNNQRFAKNLSFDLWEVDSKIAHKLSIIINSLNFDADIFTQDFLSGTWQNRYDGIIANPPYYKHHHIEEKNKVWQEICVNSLFRFSIQTNIYCWFLIKCVNLLNDGGRLAFIVPSEFLNSNYGEKVKEYLLESGIILHLININFKENVFDKALTTSIIILAEKSSEKVRLINFYNVKSIDELNSLALFLNNYPKIVRDTNKLNPKIKWRNYFNGYKENYLGEKLITFFQLGRFSRGIATGSNEFFTLNKQEVKRFNIPSECLIPCLSKANQAKDIRFTLEDFDGLVSSEKKVFLFNGECNSGFKSVKDYIKKGEQEGVNQRFLTKIREPWYALEKRDVSKIWVSVFGRKGIKFIWNESNCITLTCFHVFYPSEFGKKYLDILFLYLNTPFAKELFDREKREYGAGLGKFEPNDINKSYAFNFSKLSANDIEKLRKMQKEFLSSDDEKMKSISFAANDIFRKAFESI